MKKKGHFSKKPKLSMLLMRGDFTSFSLFELFFHVLSFRFHKLFLNSSSNSQTQEMSQDDPNSSSNSKTPTPPRKTRFPPVYYGYHVVRKQPKINNGSAR